MKTKSDLYFIELLRQKKIEVDFDSGEVYSYLSGTRKKVGAKQSAGYLHMSAGESRSNRNYILLHRLIWIAWEGEVKDGYEVNHKNGIKTDNRLINLELVTRSDNVKHALKVLGKVFGVVAAGGGYHSPKTPQSKIDEIMKLYNNGETNQSEISRLTGIRRPTVNRIINKCKS